MKQACQVFGIQANSSVEQITRKVKRKLEQLSSLLLSLIDFRSITQRLMNSIHNDDFIDYINKFDTRQLQPNERHKDYFHYLLESVQIDLKNAELIHEKFVRISPFIQILLEITQKLRDPKSHTLKDQTNLFQLVNSLQTHADINCKVVHLNECSTKRDQPLASFIDPDVMAQIQVLLGNNFYISSFKISLYQTSSTESLTLDDILALLRNIKSHAAEMLSLENIKGCYAPNTFYQQCISPNTELLEKPYDLTKISGKILGDLRAFLTIDAESEKFFKNAILHYLFMNSFNKISIFLKKFYNAYNYSQQTGAQFQMGCYTFGQFLIKNKDHAALKAFTDFPEVPDQKLRAPNFTLIDFNEINWPSLETLEIEYQQAPFFLTFWEMFSNLLVSYISDPDGGILPIIDKMLEPGNEDLNEFNQFVRKCNIGFIEPVKATAVTDFISIIKMFKSINFGDPSNPSSYERVTQDIISYFETNREKLLYLYDAIGNVLDKASDITSYAISGAIVVDEYEYVQKVCNGQLRWNISYKDRTCLLGSNDEPNVDFIKLSLIAAKLDITMIETPSSVDANVQFINSRQFVEFFHSSELLYEHMKSLHDLSFGIGDKSIEVCKDGSQFSSNAEVFQQADPLDQSKIKEKIASFEFILKIANEKFAEISQPIEEGKHLNIYKQNISRFTKEHFFMLYKIFNQIYNQGNPTNSQNFVSLFHTTYITTLNADVNSYKDKFQNDKIFEVFTNSAISNDQIDRFKQSIDDFCKVLNDGLEKIKKQTSLMPTINLSYQDNLVKYIQGSAVKALSLKSMHTQDKRYFSAISQIHSAIIQLLSIDINDNDRRLKHLPQPYQLLICSMDVTRSQVEMFLNSIHAENTTQNLIFVVVSPFYLKPDLYSYLMNDLQKFNEISSSKTRVIILYNEDELRKDTTQLLGTKIKSQRLRPPTTLSQFEQFYNLGNPKAISAYYIYEQFPRTGKTHTILSHIYNGQFDNATNTVDHSNHIYHRILIDESTNLTMLIELLNQVPRVNNKTTYIHFNVDGKCSPYFHLHIQNLALFGSLNDGHSIPFIYRKNMIFIFEFGPRPSMNCDEFIQRVFPIAKYMKKITVPTDREKFFTFDEYRTLPIEVTDSLTNNRLLSLYVNEVKGARNYLYEAAALASLSLDSNSFLNADKYAKYVRYSDFIDYYNRTVDEFKKSSTKSYQWLMKIFKPMNQGGIFSPEILNQIPNEFRNPLISQLNDVAKLLYTFKGPVLSQITYENEESLGVNIRKLLVGVLIEACVTNCGLPYIPPMEEGTTTISESSKNDTLRLNRILNFIQTGHMLAINDPGNPNPEDQSYTLIMHSHNANAQSEEELKSILRKFKYGNDLTPTLINSVKYALNVIDNEKWQKMQNSPFQLFNVFSEILNLQSHYNEITPIVELVNIWRSLSFTSKQTVSTFWQTNFSKMETAIKNHSNKVIKEISDEYNDKFKPAGEIEEEQFDLRKKFLFESSHIMGRLPFCDGNQFLPKYQPTNNVTEFISKCEKYVQDKRSLMLKYTLTPQNIERFIHLVYRIYANVPIILMGETGSGKTFTLNFLAEIIGVNVKLVKRVIDGGTTEKILRRYMKGMLAELEQERYQSMSSEFNKHCQIETSLPVKNAIQFILNQPNIKLTTVDSIQKYASDYINSLTPDVLQTYDVQAASSEQVEKFKGYIIHKLSQIYKKIESQQRNYLFFFDEVNTAPCQWFLKELIIDRYFEGKNLPEYIHFACAVNPTREITETFNKLDALEPVKNEGFEDDKANLIYKVREMPESFIPYLFPADPRRDYGSYHSEEPITAHIDCSYDMNLFDTRLNSEFDVSILKKVISEFSCKTYEYDKSADPNYVFDPTSHEKSKLIRLGDEIHFSLTDKFSTSFDFEFFDRLFKDQITSELVIDQLNYILSMINIFSCRVLYHVIYKDESFSSIRDPERCMRIVRWAYKFGMSEELPKTNEISVIFKRLRKAFIIGLSVSFYIRLSDTKDPKTKTVDREIYGENVSRYWGFILEEVRNRLNGLQNKINNRQQNIPGEISSKDTQKNGSSDQAEIAALQNEINKLNLEREKNVKILHAINVTLDTIQNHFAAPTYDEWLAILKTECDEYANIFVEEHECVSKNIALTENIWVTYICIMNNIPLWIIGKPGTSKSLAINIVINKLMNHNSLNPKVTICPHLVSQTFMCSQSSTTHAILEQLGKIVKKGRMFTKENYLINLQVLEEIGHADQSPFRPLVCLHNIIDNGYQIEQNVFVPVTLLGLSNYKMDSAKLNRGILLLRSELNEKEMELTAYEIFQSTARACNIASDRISDFESVIKSIGVGYQELTQRLRDEYKAFVGLRDFYGLIQSITRPLLCNDISVATYITLIQRNFSGIPSFSFDKFNEYKDTTYSIITELYKKIIRDDPQLDNLNQKIIEINDYTDELPDDEKQQKIIPFLSKNMMRVINDNLSQEQRGLKTPIVRQIMISTKNNAAFSILLENSRINNDRAEFFFAQNLTKFPTSDWISNELRRLATIMYKNKIAIFIGKHPCFDSLYDIFNLRYQQSGGTSSAIISYGGDSFPTLVQTTFKVIIILEDSEYKSLPQPFLNRFEKFIMTYETELTPYSLYFSAHLENYLKKMFHTRDLSTCFGCYSSELIYSVLKLIQSPDSNVRDSLEELLTLSAKPSSIVYAAKFDTAIIDYEYLTKALYDNSELHSTLLHLIKGYDINRNGTRLCDIFYREWNDKGGISAITMVPTCQGLEKIGDQGYTLVTINSMELFDLEEHFLEKIKRINCDGNPLIVALVITNSTKSTSQQIIQFEKILELVKDTVKKVKPFSAIHTLIIISMDHDHRHLKINQSYNWPLLYLDSCYKDSIIKTTTSNIPFDVKSLIFKPLSEIFPVNDRNKFANFDLNADSITEQAFRALGSSYSDDDYKKINKLHSEFSSSFFACIKNYILDIFQTLPTNHDSRSLANWAFNQITKLVTPPPSLLEYLSESLITIIANLIEINVMTALSGVKDVNALTSGFYTDEGVISLLVSHYLPNYANIANETNMLQIYPIEARYTCNIKYIGQMPFYKLIWELALHIQQDQNQSNADDFLNSLELSLFKSQPDEYPKAHEFYQALLNSQRDSQEFQLFIASYLITIAPTFRIISKSSFTHWLRIVNDLICIFFSNASNGQITSRTIIYYLSKPFISTFFKEFTIAHSLVPDLSTQSLVPDGCLNYGEIDSSYIITESSYLLIQIFLNLAQTINSLNLHHLSELCDIFNTEFSILISILYTLKLVTPYPEEGEEINENEQYFIPGYEFELDDLTSYGLYTSLQQFFILYGEKIKDDHEINEIFSENDIADIAEGAEDYPKRQLNFLMRFIDRYINCLSDVNPKEIKCSISALYFEFMSDIYAGFIDESALYK